MSNKKIYIMQDGEGLLKIGMSVDPEKRLKSILIHNPRVKIIYTTGFFSNHGIVERRSHGLLERSRVLGEWFDCPKKDAISAVDSAAERFGVKEEDSGIRVVTDDQLKRRWALQSELRELHRISSAQTAEKEELLLKIWETM